MLECSRTGPTTYPQKPEGIAFFLQSLQKSNMEEAAKMSITARR
jgi:hypothetical protein